MCDQHKETIRFLQEQLDSPSGPWEELWQDFMWVLENLHPNPLSLEDVVGAAVQAYKETKDKVASGDLA